MQRSRWGSLVGLLLILAGGLLLPPELSRRAIEGEVRANLAREVGRILPEGWAVTRTAARTTPYGWRTDRPVGFLVEGGNGTDWFSIWFLPPDWVGIRQTVPGPAAPSFLETLLARAGLPVQTPRPPGCLTCDYNQGILAGGKWLTITLSSDDSFPTRVGGLFGRSMWGASLVNGAYDRTLKVFAGKQEAADQAAQSLVARHCRSQEDFAEAAHSLILLGVPAKGVFIEAARETGCYERDSFFSALGYMGGEDAISVLCEVLADPSEGDRMRSHAAQCLEGHRDDRIGPLLHTAVRQVRDEEASARIAEGLALQRYRGAAADVLTVFRRLKNQYFKVEVAQTLASLRCRQAVPDLREFVSELRELLKKDESNRFLGERVGLTELAIQRLTGDWGTPSSSMRFLVLPPEGAILGQPLGATVCVENVGDEPLWIWIVDPDGLRIDGKDVVNDEVRGICGSVLRSVRPGEMQTMFSDLTPHITTPGWHTVQFVAGEASSAPVRFLVRCRDSTVTAGGTVGGDGKGRGQAGEFRR